MAYRKIEAPGKHGVNGPDPGPAPMLQWLEISHLVVDEAYQRDLSRGNWAMIRKIATNFRWSRFSPVFVAPIEGGRYAVIDGQHRCHAAAMCGHLTVPCQVVQMDLREQAEAFAAVNGMVTKVTTWNIYKASLTAGEEWAVRIDRIAKAAGCSVMLANKSHWSKKPGEIYGVQHFRQVAQGRDEKAVIAALAFLRRCEGWGQDPMYWDAGMLMPVLSALIERIYALEVSGFQNSFEEYDIFAVMDADQQERKDRIRKGLDYEPKKETLRAAVLTWIDKTFPQRMALPGPKPGRAEMLAAVGAIKAP